MKSVPDEADSSGRILPWLRAPLGRKLTGQFSIPVAGCESVNRWKRTVPFPLSIWEQLI